MMIQKCWINHRYMQSLADIHALLMQASNALTLKCYADVFWITMQSCLNKILWQQFKTRKLCCRKDDRAMRHGGPEFSGLPDYAHGYYSQQFSWSFVPIDPTNVPI